MRKDKISKDIWVVSRSHRFELELNLKQTGKTDGTFTPVELPDIQLAPQGIDPASFWITALDEHGQPLVFDLDAPKPDCYKIPFRFDPDYEGDALPLNPRHGRLVFLARPTPRRQLFHIYFNCRKRSPQRDTVPQYGGLIGDGDVFTQREGPLAVPGQARPVLSGNQLCGRPGLVVAAHFLMGIYFFEDIAGGRNPVLINRGRLLDRQGNVITGIPTFHDMTGNGLLDMVTGQEDGSIVWYRNIGTTTAPKFSPARPLRERAGAPLNIRPFLEGKFTAVMDKHGKVNPRYPRMPLIRLHGGHIHLNPTPVFVPGTDDDVRDLIVGTRGGFFIWFKKHQAGFEQGKILQDTAGNSLHIDGMVCFPTCSPESRPGRIIIWAGNYHGHVFRIVQASTTDDGMPVFHPPRRVNVPADVEYSFPLAVRRGRHTDLWVGDFHGHVKYFRQTGKLADGTPEFDAGRVVNMNNAMIAHHMPVVHYTDLNGDGVRDMVSGDVKGGVYGYRNLGTNTNPLFEAGRLLRAGRAPLKIQGGPDPNSPSDGYSKPQPADLSGSGHTDLLVGTGLGRIMHFAWAGLDADGLPRFRKGKPLRDTRGKIIRCHHMSGLALADWDGDGVPDLIVGGQRQVHAFPDDDPDPSQLRFYKGVRRDKRLCFMPYQPLNAEGDNVICNRPVALSVVNHADGRRLIVNRMSFRQLDPRRPTLLEFEKYLPELKIRGKEKSLGAYGTISQFGPHDPLTVQGSVVGNIYAFRDTFAENSGYPRAVFHVGRPYARNQSLAPAKRRIATASVARMKIKHRLCGKITVARVGDDMRLNRRKLAHAALQWPEMILSSRDSWMMPQSDQVTAKVAASRHGLFLLVDVVEPLMDRLICWSDHHNGPLEVDDRVEIYLDFNAVPGKRPMPLYFCMVNHRGFFKEMNLRRDDAQPEGAWRVGRQPIQVVSKIRKDGFQLALALAWAKWDVDWPPAAGQCRIEIKRRRNLYANETRAKEQRLSSCSSLSGREWGWMRIS